MIHVVLNSVASLLNDIFRCASFRFSVAILTGLKRYFVIHCNRVTSVKYYFVCFLTISCVVILTLDTLSELCYILSWLLPLIDVVFDVLSTCCRHVSSHLDRFSCIQNP